ncbi:NEDD8-conjugating enzyme Ubc12-like [Panicum miliaceum]|uniref:NEDD8-conjugating enzyme Ubc12-like n=1 Tax=Panicum miliaceum TaxID=4540 RepID=A0A3L6THJ5_PANMI|nr:NEDD8-conjugating enzyme Ubc12-like [Panicum miliaceum]
MLELEMAGSLELGSTALPLTAQGSGPQVLSLLSVSDSLLSCSSFPGGDDWASGGAICHVFGQPFAGDEHPPVFCHAIFNLLPLQIYYTFKGSLSSTLAKKISWLTYPPYGKMLQRKMINLFKIKGQKKEEAASAAGKAPVKKQSAGELRLHKDLSAFSSPLPRAFLDTNCEMMLNNLAAGATAAQDGASMTPSNISELNLPKTTSISFPNGKDDLMNFEIIIRPDEGYYMGGTFIFTFQVSPSYPHEPPKVKCKTKVYHPNIDLEGNQPNDEDPLNHEAAVVLRDNPKMFEANVKRAMAGGYVGQHYFPRCA